MPFSKSISDIKSNLLNPATTSHFYVTVPVPVGLTKINKNSRTFLQDNGINFSLNSEKLNLMCSDAILPGSSLATHDISGDYHGTTHRHVYRRLYDDRIDLSFYVDAVDYFPIRYFETWIKYISGEQLASQEGGRPGVKDRRYFYRMNYPEEYIASGLQVTKFERSMMGEAKGKVGRPIVYNFVDCFPIAIQSMPVSYDSSSLLKCTVSLSYIRYYIDPPTPTSTAATTNPAQTQALTPEQQAAVNAAYSGKFDFARDIGLNYESLTTTGGVSLPAASNSGNTVRSSFTGKSIL